MFYQIPLYPPFLKGEKKKFPSFRKGGLGWIFFLFVGATLVVAQRVDKTKENW